MLSSMCKWVIVCSLVTTTTLAPGVHNIKWLTSKELKCLADNVYYEARGENFEGMVAVAKVTLNRTKHNDYPDSICGVVYQPYQFSWTLKKQKPPKPAEYAVAKWAALTASSYKLDAIFYHSVKVKPKWSSVKTRLVQLGNHIFYY